MVLASSEAMAIKDVQGLLLLCHSLGIVIHKEKSDLVPLKPAPYLGVTIDSGAAGIFLPLRGWKNVCLWAEIYLAMPTPPAQLCRCFFAPDFAGETSSAQSSLHALSAVGFGGVLVSRVGSSLATGAIVLGGVVDLSLWMVRAHLLDGVFRFGTPAPDLHLYSDASRSGWGAHLLDRLVSRV